MRFRPRPFRRPFIRPMALPVLGIFGSGPLLLIALVSVASCAGIAIRLMHFHH